MTNQHTPAPPVAGTALSRVVEGVLVPEEITTPTDFKKFKQAWEAKGVHVLSPMTDFGSLPPGWKIVPTAVKLDPNPLTGDVYQDRLFCKNDEFAPTKVALRKLARTAGISYTTTPTHASSERHYWSAKARIEYWGYDGQKKYAEASYEWDLRDGSPRIEGMSEKELKRARLSGWRRCEAGAINAAIREYGLKQKYTVDELRHPFMVCNPVFSIDPNDPIQRRMQAAAVLGASAMLGLGELPDMTTPPGQAVGEVVRSLGPGGAAAHEEVPFDDLGTNEAASPDEPALAYKVITVSNVQNTDDYFVTVETPEGPRRLHTSVRALAGVCNEARKANQLAVIVFDDQNEILEVRTEAVK